MAYFHYKLIESNGRVRGGLINLPYSNPITVITYLEREGATVLFARLLPTLLGNVLAFIAQLFEKPVKPDDIAEALSNLAVMLRAGLPLLTSLREVLAESEHPTLRRIGQDLVLRVETGSQLSDALALYPRLFPHVVGFLARVGEESGSLDRTMADAAKHVKKGARMRKDAKRALIYPAFMFVALFGAMGFWVYTVVPLMQGLFLQLQVKLPPITLAVVGASNWIIGHTSMALIILVSVIGGLVVIIRRSERARMLRDAALLRLPIFGAVLRTYNLAFITEYLALLLAAGLDIMRALDIISGAIGNHVFKKRLKEVRQSLISGQTLRDSFQNADFFPSFVVRMISVGEESGTLQDQLAYVADEYSYRLTAIVESIGKIIEPVALMVGGTIFAFLVAALFLPLYQAIGKLGAH